jgi:hypothetical protein
MSDDRHHRLRLCAIYASRRRARLQVLDGLEAIGQVGEPKVGKLEVGDLGFGGFAATSASGASWRSPDPFAVRPGRRASSRTSGHVTLGPPIPWSSCSGMPPMFMQPEVMGVSWPTGFRWPQRESLAGGSAGCLRGPSHPGGISASASSTGTHLWDPSQRVRRRTSPLMALSPGA